MKSTKYIEIKDRIFTNINSLLEDKSHIIMEDTPLIGGAGVLDSMKLVELCLLLEDAAIELGFEFDWTSDEAMSKSRGMFRNAGALTNEFIKQLELKK
jgi:acyl carrier protein